MSRARTLAAKCFGLAALGIAAALGACSGDDEGPVETGANPAFNDPKSKTVEVLPDPLAGLPSGKDQLAKVCARGQQDAVTRGLCGGREIKSIDDVLDALGLAFRDREGENGARGNPAFALLGHSSSLVARSVSAINPRAFVFTPPPGQPARLPGYVVVGFARGEPFVEIAAEDADQRKLTFYLLRFVPSCEAKGGHDACQPKDLLTPSIEKNWTSFSLYDDEDLKNTIVDCRHCHQPDGPGTQTMLRMQELVDPWTHWFHSDREGGRALLQDFQSAHGMQEDYGGIPARIIAKADGLALEDLVAGQGFDTQPNVFDSVAIEDEVKKSASGQPRVNTPRGKSSTWQTIYESAFSGQFIPVPYHDVKVTDPDRLAFATASYDQFRNGKSNELPDIRRVFLDDAMSEMTFRPKKGATGKQILVQTCAQCHNGKLDQEISRARFDVTKLDTMDAETKRRAISRIKLPAADRGHMPPAIFRSLPDDAIKAVIAELSK